MPAPILLGQSDFPSLRESGKLYVDKSAYVAEVLDAPAQVMLYPRPRRFGKTLNLSMLHAFFEIGPDRSELFHDLAVWQDAAARAHFQRHPVIKLTFKDVKQRTWAESMVAIRGVLSTEVGRHAAAVTDARVPGEVRQRLEATRAEQGDPARTLLDLSQALAVHHGQKVVLLIDEYDASVLNAWEHGHYDEAISFFRGLLSPGLKDNPFLYKGVLTGILRVSRESMFSDLNNVKVYSLLDRDRGEFFGFTEPEVLRLLDAFGRSSEVDDVRRWYNGYRFGTTTVYNPWSIMMMLAQPRSELGPHWINTSTNALVRSLLLENAGLSDDIGTLIRGGSIEREIDDNVALRDLRGDHIWSLFLFSGYLRAEAVRIEEGMSFVTLSVPNIEVRTIWSGTFREWLRDRTGGIEPLHAAILEGDAEATEWILAHMLRLNVSSHDVASDQDEVFYHAFVLGLLVTLERTHAVRSNREVGRGRADVQIIPKRPGLPGVVIEFKRRQVTTALWVTAEEARAQIEARAYGVELDAAGASPIHKLGIAFGGKEVVVRA